MRRSILILLLLTCTPVFSQVEDAELWLGVGLKADISKKLSLKYETQTRFYKNASVLRTYYNELSADYEVIKNLELGLTYRYSRKNDETHFMPESRFCFNASHDVNLGKTGLELKNRLRYQLSFDRPAIINDVIYPDSRSLFRWKVELGYEHDDFKRMQPFVGYEYFKHLQPLGFSGFSDAYRLYGGIDFDLPARHEIGIKYVYERENRNTPSIGHFYVIQYNYELSSKLFKRKKD